MKAGGKIKTLVKGVSEQVPELRPQGQMTEQVNLSPDPVQGLSRRFPTLWKNEKVLVANTSNTFDQIVADTNNWRTFDYFSEGKDYTLCVRRAAAVATDLPFMTVYNRTDDVFLTLARPTVDTDLDALVSGGVSAMTSIGKYVFMAGNSLLPSMTQTDQWGSNANLSKAVIWIRGGAFARTYTADVTKLDGTPIHFEYTTPTSSYPHALDTSGVPVFLPDTSGATPGTGPTLAYAIENVPGPVSDFGLLAGQTYTLIHAANSPTNIFLDSTTGSGESYNPGTWIAGLHYTYSAGVITALVDMGPVHASYQYTAGGTSATSGYVSIQEVEAAFIRDDGTGSFGVAELTWKDWAPSALSVKNGEQLLTNSYPASPANGNQYAWDGTGAKVVFDKSMRGNLRVTITYNHIKTTPNPNYSKQVNDITNDFNTKVTNWLGTSAAAIEPDAIAESLRLAAVAAGLTTATRQGSTIIFDNVKSIAVNDGGDGTLIRGVADEVATVDDVSVIHAVGKVVRVRAATSKESFYLIATAKDRTVTTGYTEVIWIEGAGTVFTVNAHFIYGTAIGSTFYVASSAAALQTLAGITDVPDYVSNSAGDVDTNPPPYFIGRKITYLGIFQDRMLVGCGGVLRVSKTAEYLTFFRSTVLTLPADDAMEFLSQGAADDELRYGVLYDQNLVLFGLKRQYIINGKQPLTPTNANMVPMSSHADAAELPPLSAGDFIFYGKKGPSSSSVHQIQPGENTTSPASYIISSQIDLYLKGDAIELASQAKPNTLFLRTAGSRSSIYLFSYFDQQEGRKQDAWHRWDYNPAAGCVVGMQSTPQGLLVFTMRLKGTKLYMVADLQVMTTGLATTPYLDSQRTVADLLAHSTDSMTLATAGLSVAFDATTQWMFLGRDASQYAALLTEFPVPGNTHAYVGYPYECFVTPTNPYQRNGDGDAVTSGRLTVGKFIVDLARTSGLSWTIRQQGVADISHTFNGRIIGDPTNLIGREPVTNFQHSLVVGRESKNFNIDIKARKWFPFTIKEINWVGQLFNRTQQIS